MCVCVLCVCVCVCVCDMHIRQPLQPSSRPPPLLNVHVPYLYPLPSIYLRYSIIFYTSIYTISPIASTISHVHTSSIYPPPSYHPLVLYYHIYSTYTHTFYIPSTISTPSPPVLIFLYDSAPPSPLPPPLSPSPPPLPPSPLHTSIAHTDDSEAAQERACSRDAGFCRIKMSRGSCSPVRVREWLRMCSLYVECVLCIECVLYM